MHDSAWAAGATPRHPSAEDRDMSTPYTPADTPGVIASTPRLDSGAICRSSGSLLSGSEPLPVHLTPVLLTSAGTPGFGYGEAGTPALDQRTPGTVDAYSPAFGQTAATPSAGLTPAFADSGEAVGAAVAVIASLIGLERISQVGTAGVGYGRCGLCCRTAKRGGKSPAVSERAGDGAWKGKRAARLCSVSGP